MAQAGDGTGRRARGRLGMRVSAARRAKRGLARALHSVERMKAWILGSVMMGGIAACAAACNAAPANVDSFDQGIGDPRDERGTGIGAAASMCTIDDSADAGLAPIGPNGCAAGTVIVYRKTLSPGAGGSAVGSAGEATASGTRPASGDADSDAGSAFAPMTPACAPLSCKPGQVGVVTWASAPGSLPGPPTSDSGPPLPDTTAEVATNDGGGDDGATASDGGAAPTHDGGTVLGDGGTTASDGGTTASDGDAASGPGVPLPSCLGFVIKCIDAPPSCPSGQAPSYAPSGKWHCMPLCNPSDPRMVVISYGGQFGSTRVCAGAPPQDSCANAGDVWTWDYKDEEWVCRPKCDNGMYDQHEWGGQTVCVPC